MKHLLLQLLLMWVCTNSFAQLYGRIDCEWQPSDSLRRYMVRCDDEPQPKIWKRFPNANHIWEISNGWRISHDKENIAPEYIIFRYDDISRTPSMYDALQLAYNYFSKHPGKNEYRHKDFIVLVSRIKKEE